MREGLVTMPVPTWLYQMANTPTAPYPRRWSPDLYRREVELTGPNTFTNGSRTRVVHHGLGDPAPGHHVIFFFVPHNCAEPGIYGWGKVVAWDSQAKDLTFQLWPPSGQLQKSGQHLWDPGIRAIVNSIRRPVYLGTLFRILDSEHIDGLLDRIKRSRPTHPSTKAKRRGRR
jgi:hypothetical protein